MKEKKLMIEARVAEIMKKQRWQIQKVADETGLSYQTVFNLYHNKNTMIKFDVLDRLCNLFQCEPGDILKRVENKAV